MLCNYIEISLCASSNSGVKCPLPPDGINSYVPDSASVQYNFEDNVTYVCQEGYRDKSNSTRNRTCGVSGTWTGQALECEGEMMEHSRSRYLMIAVCMKL